MSSLRRVAFFDLDNTIIRGSSIFYLFKGLSQRGFFDRKSIARFTLANFNYIRKREEDTDLIQQIMCLASRLINGIPSKELRESCQEIVADFLPKYHNREITERILNHTEMGDETWLITAAPVEIAKSVANELNMTGAIGTKSQIQHGIYTGKLLGRPLHGSQKELEIRKISIKRKFDLGRSFAYSDSINDLPMLLAVGKPVVVNPNKELLRIATKNRWQVISN